MSPTFLCFPLLSFILASSLIVLLFLLLNYFWAPISVFISLSFPFFPILLNDFIYSWASVTTYISVAARSTFPARTLLESTIIIFSLHLSSLCLLHPPSRVPVSVNWYHHSSIHSFIQDPKPKTQISSLFPMSNQSPSDFGYS